MGERKRGQLTSLAEREIQVKLIRDAVKAGARLIKACVEAALPLRTYRRWFKKGTMQQDKRPDVVYQPPANKLSETERQQILDVCNQGEYSNLPPSQIVPKLLDKGCYLASESTFYRILKAEGQLTHRGKARAPQKRHKLTSYCANKHNQVWSWDITYLPSRVKGQFFYLYMYEDIYSRKIVGQEVYDKECGELASQLLQRNLLREQCFTKPPVLHSDNGAPMKSLTMKSKMEELGVVSSHNRPRVSNDNPYSESLFRTMKYCPKWPSTGFTGLEEARNWVSKFTDWYNNEHLHSKLRYITPNERHQGKDSEILSRRKQVMTDFRGAHPYRFSGELRNFEPIGAVYLNPDREPVNLEKKVS